MLHSGVDTRYCLRTKGNRGQKPNAGGQKIVLQTCDTKDSNQQWIFHGHYIKLAQFPEYCINIPSHSAKQKVMVDFCKKTVWGQDRPWQAGQPAYQRPKGQANSCTALDCDLLLLCQHDHCESNAFIVVDHHDQWPWLESLLSTNMLFSVCFSWPYSMLYTYIWHFPGS